MRVYLMNKAERNEHASKLKRQGKIRKNLDKLKRQKERVQYYKSKKPEEATRWNSTI